MSWLGNMLRPLRRIWKSDAGSATVEFAIIFPFYVTLFMTTVELGMITFRHSMLERGLDMAVRDVRLNTGSGIDHTELKDRICHYSGVLPDCASNLRLEMILVDPRNYSSPSQDADCIDHSEDPTTPRTFDNAGSNQSVLLRACFVFSPIFPTSGLGYHLEKDGAGNTAMVAMSAFVQEPR